MPGREAERGHSSHSRAFINRLQRCVKPQPAGRQEIDFERIVAVVAADLPGAREYIDFACGEALATPGFLAPAALVAGAYRDATGTTPSSRRVEARKRAVRASGDPEHPLRRPQS